jgi:hypothetical protein
MGSSAKAKPALEPLDIKCTASDCDNNLHCFLATKKMLSRSQKGACRSCGTELVDWGRVHKQDAGDAAYTFRMLKLELIRHHFWHKDIDEKAVKHARRKGRFGMRAAVGNRLRKSLRVNHPMAGRQTPKQGNAIFYAQHATGTCCRRCLEEWHDIPRDRELTEGEVGYLSSLCTMFIDERLPYLTEHGETIPPTRRARQKPEESPPDARDD